MNPSDDPTRSVPLRTPCSDKPAFQTLPISELYGLSKLPKSKRWAANWVALVIGLSCRGEFSMDFDSTLGYPGRVRAVVFSSSFGFLPWLSCS